MAELHLTDAQLLCLAGYIDNNVPVDTSCTYPGYPLMQAMVEVKRAADDVLLAEQARRRGVL